MKLTDDLAAEHELIERVVGSFLTFIAQRVQGSGRAVDAGRFFRFFRSYVGGFHHDREEEVLFPALTDTLGLPGDRGPVAALLAQHHELAGYLNELEPLLEPVRLDPSAPAAIELLAKRYAHGLWHHIDAENSVLFPESAIRLERAGCLDLPGRDPTQDEAEARDDGARLVLDYPPLSDPTLTRGEGCVSCPSYGTACEGIERAWWNESEWDEFADHLG